LFGFWGTAMAHFADSGGRRTARGMKGMTQMKKGCFSHLCDPCYPCPQFRRDKDPWID
jgi:hypothetical protein